ncbi:MAG: cytidylate kinase family protein [Chloroflexi bacterium]|nr:cytidylate kinase family protein [Chloroflexota bacterium]MBV9546392.1 cytidylate kinase family protein [Chloroflexota bacterium]
MAVITFSREPHSGTRDIARLLAERLGYRYVSRDELTEAVRARSGLERTPHKPESEGRALSLLDKLGEQLTGDQATYRAALKAVVTELAMSDNVVMVGHGAGQFLGDVRGVIRVLVVAPMEDRIARVMAEGEVDADRARRIVEEQEHESGAYLRDLFGIDWLDPHHWDLVINAGRASTHATLDMLVHYAESLVRNQSDQETLSRIQLATRIEQALLADDELGVSKLRVHIETGAVVLEGEALAQEDRERAEERARWVDPRVPLDNRIVVRPPQSA